MPDHRVSPEPEQPELEQPEDSEAQPHGSGHSVADQLSGVAAQRLTARDDGSLDVMASIGGWRGLVEAALPATAFLVTYLLTENLTWGIVLALGIGAVFSAVRLLQRGTTVQALSGVAGVAICAAFAYFSGDARGYYEPGFYVNGAYIAAFIISIMVKWPFVGVLFGLIRGEGFEWRQDRRRRRRYALATWIIVAIMASRLAVQIPLFLADNIAALGASRLVMGLPLYALGLWLGWMITREEPAPSQSQERSV